MANALQVADKIHIKEVTSSAFIEVMARAATQVTVITTDGIAGRLGVTVSAFTSVSAEPPLVLVCIKQSCPAIAAIEKNGVFCVNLLNENQSEIADCFAGRSKIFNPYDFACAEWDGANTSSPILKDAIANFDCAVNCTYCAGSHRIFIGRVTALHSSNSTPLIFSNRSFQALRMLSPQHDRNSQQ